MKWYFLGLYFILTAFLKSQFYFFKMSFLVSIFSKLKRITSEKYIPEIDSLRFFAILPVIILHFNTTYYRLFINIIKVNKSYFDEYIEVGVWGVELFFAISGFVISSPFF